MNIGKIADTTLSIAGMGIGLGLLAHTAKTISKMYSSNKSISVYGKRAIKNISKNTYKFNPPKLKYKKYHIKW